MSLVEELLDIVRIELQLAIEFESGSLLIDVDDVRSLIGFHSQMFYHLLEQSIMTSRYCSDDLERSTEDESSEWAESQTFSLIIAE